MAVIGDRERAWDAYASEWAPPNPGRYRRAWNAGYYAGQVAMFRRTVAYMAGMTACCTALVIMLALGG